MKRTILLALFTLFSINAFFAQTNTNEDNEFNGFNKGDFVVMGSLSYYNSQSSDNKNKTTITALMPKVGYFISKHFLLGVSFEFKEEKSKNYLKVPSEYEFSDDFTEYLGGKKAKLRSPGLFGRYYFSPNNKFSFFGELNVAYQASQIEVYEIIMRTYDSDSRPSNIQMSQTNYKEKGFVSVFSPGIYYFLSKSFILEASFGVLSYKYIDPDYLYVKPTNTFDVGFDLSNLNLGLVYKF